MGCHFSVEDITAYVDDVLSLEDQKEFINHFRNCERCRKIHDTLAFTRDFLKEEKKADKSINEKILGRIDRERYSKRRKQYAIWAGVNWMKHVFKPAVAVLAVCSILLLVVVWGSNFKEVLNDNFPIASESEMKPVNILVLGGDKVNKNTDAIVLINYDPGSAALNLLSIPRDTLIEPTQGKKEKINFAYPSGGMEYAVETVRNLLDVEISYYMYVDMKAVEKMIDLLGGVDYYIPTDMHYDDPVQDLHIHFNKGQQRLNGKQVVEFMRFRQPNRWTQATRGGYDGSDIRRVEAQQKMVKALAEQKINFRSIEKINSIVQVLYQGVETNLSLGDALKLLKDLSKFNQDKLNTFILPGNPSDYQEQSFFYLMDKEKGKAIVSRYFK